MDYKEMYDELYRYHLDFSKQTWSVIDQLHTSIDIERKEVQRLIEILYCRRD